MGARERRRIVYGRLADGAEAAYPLVEVRGDEPGPSVALVGGVHGDEYEGPEALWALAAELEPRALRGRVSIVPVANVPAFAAGRRTSPIDGKDLARLFPGDPGGTLSERLASSLLEHVVSQADVLVDSHSGGVLLAYLPVAGYYAEGEGIGAAAAAASLETARQSALPYLWRLPARHGVLSFEAARRGLAVCGVEIGGRGHAERGDVECYLEAYRSVLAHRDMLDACHARTSLPLMLEGDFERAPVGGYLRNAVALGERVGEGTVIAEILGIEGETVHAFRAPFDALIMAERHLGSIGVGDHAVCPVRVRRA